MDKPLQATLSCKGIRDTEHGEFRVRGHGYTRNSFSRFIIGSSTFLGDLPSIVVTAGPFGYPRSPGVVPTVYLGGHVLQFKGGLHSLERGRG